MDTLGRWFTAKSGNLFNRPLMLPDDEILKLFFKLVEMGHVNIF